jgi:hypothetical protein
MYRTAMEMLLFKDSGLVSLHAEEYDHCMDYVGLGPVFLLAVAPGALPRFLLSYA